MAVFRVEKTQNYTIMSNHHLHNESLSLKAKGLLSQMLSLPEKWDYTLKGLSLINRESVEAIRTAVLELVAAGYIVRRQNRDGRGKMANIEYTIYEQPQVPDRPDPDKQPISPSCDFPISDKPTSEKPLSDSPISENPTQINKDNKEIKNLIKTERLKTDSIPIPPPSPPPSAHEQKPGREGSETKDMRTVETYRKIILENIEYPFLLERHKLSRDRIDEIVDLMVETVCSARKTIRVAGDDYPIELVRDKFLKLDMEHIDFVLDCMQKNTTEIRNIKKYLLAALFNASSTISNYYASLVSHDTG